jgi:ABC-type multidrug transport system fused ATPase/permease subunit
VKGTQITNVSQFLIGNIAAFVSDWRLALIGLSSLPVLMIVMGALMPGMMKQTEVKFKAIAESMTIAEESFGAVRTVKGSRHDDEDMRLFRKA